MQKEIFICIKNDGFICRKMGTIGFSMKGSATEKVAVTSARRLLLLIMCCFAAQTESHNTNVILVLWLLLFDKFFQV
jgi:hypothetical protein